LSPFKPTSGAGRASSHVPSHPGDGLIDFVMLVKGG
jgi:hypothetical protein